MEAKKGMAKSTKIKWLISIILPISICFIPVNDIFTVPIRSFIAVTLFGILLFGFELVETMVGALILMFGYVIAQVAPIATVMTPWTQDLPWMMLGSLLLVVIVQKTTLLNRIAYFCVIKTGGTYTGIIMGLITIGIIVSLLVPASTAVIGLFVIAFSLVKALDLGVSKASAGIMLATAMGFMDAYYFVYSPTYIALLYNAVQAVVPVEPNYVTFFTDNAIFLVGLYIKGFILAKITKPKQAINGKQYFIEEQSKLATMTINEKKILGVLLALVAYLLTYSLHHQSMLYGFIIAPLVLYLPGFKIGTKADIASIDYATVFFIAACMSIGSAATYVGVGEAFSSIVYPLLQNAGQTTFFAILWVIIVIFNFLMTPAAEMATFGVPFAQICLDCGINVYPMMYTFFQGGSNLLLPYEAAMWLVVYSFGVIKLKDFVSIMGVKMIFDFLFLMTAGLAYWRLIGLL